MSNGYNDGLARAKSEKNDEFYTQYDDIQKELNAYLEYDANTFRDKTVLLPCDDPEWSNFTKFFAQNFEFYGMKKLISTSYAVENKKYVYEPQLKLNLFDDDPNIDEAKEKSHGKIFTLDRSQTGRLDMFHLKWQYLEGDGDFRSDEVKRLRDEADIIVTNPPFSMFREFLAWILEADKKFLIIGNVNCITYKEVFPLIKDNKIWMGVSIHSGDREFSVPSEYGFRTKNSRIDKNGMKYIRVPSIRWLTNLEHGRRHEPMMLMSMRDNLKYSRHKQVRELGYQRYDNYDAIDVPFTECIPDDYKGVMGVPITFLDKYCPEQFEIVGLDRYTVPKECLVGGRVAINGKPCYARILIRHKI